jgi:hypothetical protein
MALNFIEGIAQIKHCQGEHGRKVPGESSKLRVVEADPLNSICGGFSRHHIAR